MIIRALRRAVEQLKVLMAEEDDHLRRTLAVEAMLERARAGEVYVSDVVDDIEAMMLHLESVHPKSIRVEQAIQCILLTLGSKAD